MQLADNKQPARVLNYCISPVVSTCVIDSQRGFIFGRQLAQNAADLDYKSRMDVFEFLGGVMLSELIHSSSIGVVDRIPSASLYNIA